MGTSDGRCRTEPTLQVSRNVVLGKWPRHFSTPETLSLAEKEPEFQCKIVRMKGAQERGGGEPHLEGGESKACVMGEWWEACAQGRWSRSRSQAHRLVGRRL